ncbi:MAG: hypothetical protein QME88_04065 [Actinomycetota bacterium]|nr:hypothetical protein [Actinomycetota bacterium]
MRLWGGRRGVGYMAILPVLIALATVGLASLAGCGAGEEAEKGAGEMTIEELWSRAQEADSEIRSWHMEIASYYENTQYGSGQIQSIIIDVNGDDLHEQDLLLGQVYFEYKRVEGKQYNRNMSTGTWEEVTPDASSDAAREYSSQFLELPSLAESQSHLGTETIGGEEAERFRFLLGPEAVKSIFSSQPSFDFSANKGGEVEVWIDSDEYYLLRYEIVIREVIIPEKIGKGDIRFVVNISGVNEPVEIEPPF